MKEYAYHHMIHPNNVASLLNEMAQDGWEPSHVIPIGGNFGVVLERRKRPKGCNSLKSSDLMSEYDILTQWMKYDSKEAEEIIARKKIEKLEELKMQVIAQNPQLLGKLPGEQ